MKLLSNESLVTYHTFSIDQSCDVLVEASSIDELIAIYSDKSLSGKPKLLIGKGSNLLFTEHFSGVVVLNRIKGIEYHQSNLNHHLHVCSGEDWPSLVEWTIQENIPGLENLAMIPGCAGSAPIQNIGAYGVEFKDVCEYVDILHLENLQVIRMSTSECNFGYRDSVFKHELYDKAIVVGIGLKLPKVWGPVIQYGPLKELERSELTSAAVYTKVCEIRSRKLPDPEKIGNAGSFFKNPLITKEQFDHLKSLFPSIVGYADGGKVKVAAGWLIDQCGLKGTMIGGAQVHKDQALVLINANQATSEDVVDLAELIRRTVWEKYQIALEHEVRFISSDGETSLSRMRGCINERI